MVSILMVGEVGVNVNIVSVNVLVQPLDISS